MCCRPMNLCRPLLARKRRGGDVGDADTRDKSGTGTGTGTRTGPGARFSNQVCTTRFVFEARPDHSRECRDRSR